MGKDIVVLAVHTKGGRMNPDDMYHAIRKALEVEPVTNWQKAVAPILKLLMEAEEVISDEKEILVKHVMEVNVDWEPVTFWIRRKP